MITTLRRTRVSANLRRWLWLVGLLAAAAISSVVVAIHPWKGNATLKGIGLSSRRELAPSEPSRAVGPRDNVAAQRAGPPDPDAEKTAAISAEKAAERAAALAASAQTN
jgi:hypothetical protein